ncbi:helix-turn-helix domain-containing protein [Halarchaeum nitratireducens]|uniref:DNA-binding protein n=1 Tax=Halarchaeum nitratireducens TaxID=489913 RepID=A0A830GDC5_9EURY|nr:MULTISPECIES: helix-turn-helix domain-containing protein [Halarchaeum]MBP2251050.1 putative DNA binding protein [Halarchaeum solikamskense]GGN21898.1 DNA-binding protein [Halarchaeum nitratireducens]
MPSGIRTTVSFLDADVCPLGTLSNRAAATLSSIAVAERRADTDPPSRVRVLEFSTGTAPDSLADAPNADPDPVPVPIFEHGETIRYRLDVDADVDCPRRRLCELGCPVVRHEVRAGVPRLTFYAEDYDRLRDVVADLRERFPSMDIERFVRSPAESTSGDDVFVDAGRLTDRQLEVLETAYEMGYFERPRRANATEVAAALGIGPTTFSEHLVAAQSKILDDLL